MSKTEIIVMIGFVIGLGIFAYVAYRFLTALLPFVSRLFDIMTWPIRMVWGWLKSCVCDLLPVRFTCGAELFGGVGSLVIFLASLAFVAIVFVVTAIRGELSDVMERMIYNTTMGTFFSLFSGGFDISPAAVVSVGFSACLATTCMKSAEDVPWFIWIPYCLVFVAMSAILASYLAPVFETVGNWGVDSLRSLRENADAGFFVKLGRIIALLFLGYFAVVCFVMVLREYYACFCFGPITLAAILAVTLVLQLTTGYGTGADVGVWVDVLYAIMFFGGMILIEYLRERAEGEEI